ncbi:hypothetical protein [Homoserinibacter sp. GY 40078]|uniref:hypothetical protein n=1 Tax=Homoserinibacter sp. GY 40078 TaxID=2603275 RepID=UPI00164FDA6F|nr:hypothetical protein [Homoserinibacter sp. GY 40078]
MRALTIAAALMVGLGLATVSAGPASATRMDHVDDGEPGLLTLQEENLPDDVILQPGDSVYWLVTTSLEAETDGDLDLTIESAGSLAEHPGGLTVDIDECAAPWLLGATATCPAGERTHLVETPFALLRSPETLDMGELVNYSDRYLLVTLALPDATPAELQGGEAEFQLTFSAVGDLETIGVDPSAGGSGTAALGATGAAATAPLAVAVLMGVIGIAMRIRGRRV